MLNREKHQLIMGRILRDVYYDGTISSKLGFKGDTCAYFFYGLSRFSVDLDFDLLKGDGTDLKSVSETVKKILENYGDIKDSQIKRNTIFFLLSYGDADHNIKFEVSTRMQVPGIKEHFELKQHLGISMLVAKKPYLFAGKLASLSLRKLTAMRDIYDIWYFAKNNWYVDTQVLQIIANKRFKDHLSDCIDLIEKVKDNQILRGLGELLDEKDKTWIKINLRKDVIFLLKNYRLVLK